MPEQEQERRSDWKETLYNIFQDLMRQWLLIVGVGITMAIAADLFITFTYKPLYTAQATFVMKVAVNMERNTENEEIAEAFDYILKSNVFLDKIKEELGINELNGSYESELIQGTNMIKISATAEKPRLAYLMMYAMLDNYREVSEKVIGDTQIEVIDNVLPPKVPDHPLSHLKNFMIFGAAGAGIMMFFLAVLSSTHDTIKGKKDIEEKLQIRVLGSIVKEPKLYFRGMKPVKKKSILISQISTSFWFVEGFKTLRAAIERNAQKNGCQVLMVTSSAENEGKSMMTANLALSFAENQKKVLVADMDFRKPAIYKIMDFEKNDAFTDVMAGKTSWKDAVYHDERSGVDFLLKSEYTENASELLESPMLKEMFLEMKEEYDYIFVDSAPVSYMSDAVILSKSVDGVLLTIRQNYMPVPLINRSLNRIMVTKTPVIGGILNRGMRRSSSLFKDSYAHYYYGGEKQNGRRRSN